MDVRFYTDQGTGQPHIYNHGVSEEEVVAVLKRPGEDRPGHGGSRVAVGQTNAGRHLRVIYVPDDDGAGVFVVTAFELTGKPLFAYRRRMRRRRR